MVVVQSTFPLSAGTTVAQFKALMEATVQRYRTVPGLRHKAYIFDAKHLAGGGIYVFETQACAEQCFSPEMLERVEARFGRFELRWFDCPIVIDNLAQRINV